MLARFLALAILLGIPCGVVQADEPDPTIQTTSADTAGSAGRGCLTFSKKLDAGASSHAGDFLSFSPPAQPGIEISGNQLCLSGMAYGTHYAVTVHAGLAFVDGTRKRTNETARLDMPDRDPLVAVAGRGWILPRQSATGVTIQTINVPMVRIRVLRISEHRLIGGTASPDPAKQSFSLWELQTLTGGVATEIWSGTMQTRPGRNLTVETAFPLAGLVDPNKPGAFIVLAEDAAQPAAKLVRNDQEPWNWEEGQKEIAGHWVLSTDLGLSTLKGTDGLHATVRALGSALPLAGVRLQLLSVAQDVLAETTTNPDGSAVFTDALLRGKRGASAATLLATTPAGDMAMQNLAAPAFDLSDRGAEGRAVPGPIEAYVYTDRGIYRPGETVHVMALLRTHGLTATDGTGLTLLLRRPDGMEAGRTTLPPQPDAGFQHTIELSGTAAQGNWTIEALVDPSLPPVGRALIAVQDFVPQQLKVTVSGPSAPVMAGAHLTAAIDGRFLYGAPAAGLHAEGEIRLVRDAHPVAGAADYSFGRVDDTIADPVQPLELNDADQAGHVAIDVALKLPPGLSSPVRAVLDAGLTEPGGRAVRETVSVPVRTQALLIGIRKAFGDHVDSGDAADFAVRTFASDGTPAARNGLAWRLVREEPHWDWWRDTNATGAWTFHFHTIDIDAGHGNLDVPADRPGELTQKPEWGTYRLIVTDTASAVASSVRFSVGWGGGDSVADVPDRLEVTTDHQVLALGQTAQVHLRGPFAGAAEVTVESGGKVLETRRLDLPLAGTTMQLTASDDWGPGAHILAKAYRPLTAPARAHDPVRAVGLAWIASDAGPRTLGVTIGGVRQVTPRQTVQVPIHVTGAHGPAFVTLAAVDEGILQLTHFSSPDPVTALFGRTRLGVDLRDDYGRLLEGHADTGALHEGGDQGSLGGQGLPVTTTRIVALFHGPVALDPNGDATLALDLPDFAGELRLMAVAYDHDAAGHADAALTIRDPVVADLSLPRFLAPDDVADVGISLNDTDGPAGDYHLALAATGAIAFRDVTGLDIHLDRGERREAHVSLAARQIGIGHVQATLTGPGNLRIEHAWDIAVRSPHPDLVLSQTEAQAPGETYRPDPAMLSAFVPGSTRLTIGYSTLGGIDVPGLLQSLYTYPYGCTEQLSASAFPLLYFNDARLLGRKPGDPAVHARVQAAIETITDRQDAAGQFGLWRVGDNAASVWLNVFALDFLLHARDAGFVVPDRVTATAAAWIDQRLQSGLVDNGGVYAEPAQPTRAYAAYVLARTSRVDPARLRVLSHDLMWDEDRGSIRPQTVAWRDKVGLAAPLSLAQLAGAQSLMGDANASAATFRLAIANLDTQAVPDWWYGAFYYSRLRDTAGVLAVAAETGHTQAVAPLLERISRQNPDPEQMNTQEKAWLLVAAHALLKQGGTRMLAVDGEAPRSVALPFAVTPSPEELSRGSFVLNADKQPVFRTVTLRGSPLVAPPALSQGFTLRRETFTLNGDKLDDSRLRQTDRFVVVLSGTVHSGDYRRAVVVDPLPAGLEIEAPVLREDTYPFIGELTRLRAHEQRDDRFVAAFDAGSHRWYDRDVNDDLHLPLEANAFRIAYVVRAVTPGHFARPETVVEDMYRPQVMARTASGQIDIAPR